MNFEIKCKICSSGKTDVTESYIICRNCNNKYDLFKQFNEQIKRERDMEHAQEYKAEMEREEENED